jgi:hypothetical protein
MLISRDTPIAQVPELDSEHVKQNCLRLARLGLLDLIENIPNFFDSLKREFEAGAPSPEASVSDEGVIELPWEFVLKVLMLQSATAQYLHAVSHLLRGHSIEMFGHVRTMAENAGVAYLSLRTPSIAVSYIHTGEEYRKQTISSSILPKNDPLTSQLNEDFKTASRMFHSNFESLAGKIRTSVRHTETEGMFENAMNYYDDDAEQGRFYLRHALWFLAVSSRILRLLAVSCAVPTDALWYTRIEQFERAVATHTQAISKKTFPNAWKGYLEKDAT